MVNYITQKMLVQRLRSAKPVFGLKSALKKSFIFVYDKYFDTLKLDQNVLQKVRVFDLNCLMKIKSLLDRRHLINVVGV